MKGNSNRRYSAAEGGININERYVGLGASQQQQQATERAVTPLEEDKVTSDPIPETAASGSEVKEVTVASEADDDPDPRHYQYIGAKDRLRTPQAVGADTITESARYHFAPKNSY